MAEELVLTDPIVVPAETTERYRIRTILMDAGYANTNGTMGLVGLTLQDNLDKTFYYQYTGSKAMDFIKFVNTGNFSSTSLQKRIMTKLSDEGILPGTVVGTPDA
jgi:hypothetical protein